MSTHRTSRQTSEQKFSPFFYLCAVSLACALIFGGGAHPGFLSDTILQLLSLPLFLAALWRVASSPALRRGIWLDLGFCGLIAFFVVLQLAPLPPAIWTHLPGREPLVGAFKVLGMDRFPWKPLAIDPTEAWLSALSLLPPFAIFFGALALERHERRRLSLVALGVGLLSLVIALFQVTRSLPGPLWFSDLDNPGEALGFFHNRNHFAALLYSLIPFASAWALNGWSSAGAHARSPRQKSAAGRLMSSLLGFAVMLMLICGVIVARSRMGAILGLAALFGTAALANPGRGSGRESTGVPRLIGGAVFVALLFSLEFALDRLLERFEIDPHLDSRLMIYAVSVKAAKAMFPFGAGQGAFVPVFAMFQKPADILANIYVNHAHNDYLQLVVETGLLGPALLVIFAFWYVRASIGVWTRSADEATAVDRSLAAAGAMTIGFLAIHSAFDYPLRTAAMEAIFALSCAYLRMCPKPRPVDRTRHAPTPGRRIASAPRVGSAGDAGLAASLTAVAGALAGASEV